jgi:hypothetical protein
VSEVVPADCDWIIIATLDDADRIVTRLQDRGFPRDGLVTLRGGESGSSATPSKKLAP